MKISGVSFTPAAEPDPDPVPPAGLTVQRRGRQQVGDDEQHEQQVDLAEGQRLLHRLGEQGQRGHPERGAQPHPGPVRVTQRAEHQPQRQPEGGQADQGHGPAHRRPGQHRRDREDHRGERGIGELDAVLPGPVVQRRGPVGVVGGRDVPDDQPAVPVHHQVPHGGHRRQVSGQVGHVDGQDRQQQHGPGREQPARTVPGRARGRRRLGPLVRRRWLCPHHHVPSSRPATHHRLARMVSCQPMIVRRATRRSACPRACPAPRPSRSAPAGTGG